MDTGFFGRRNLPQRRETTWERRRPGGKWTEKNSRQNTPAGRQRSQETARMVLGMANTRDF
jgi:hypothetical protein